MNVHYLITSKKYLGIYLQLYPRDILKNTQKMAKNVCYHGYHHSNLTTNIGLLCIFVVEKGFDTVDLSDLCGTERKMGGGRKDWHQGTPLDKLNCCVCETGTWLVATWPWSP